MPNIKGPLLIAFGGLPGTGKATIAQRLARECGATYLRINIIEQAVRAAGEIGSAGYLVGYGLAEANLKLGQIVVADSVNPLAISRSAWRGAAASAAAPVIEVETICSDLEMHRRRVEARGADIPGHALPDWAAVVSCHYEPWPQPHLVIDTAHISPAEAVALILEACVAQGVQLRPHL